MLLVVIVRILSTGGILLAALLVMYWQLTLACLVGVFFFFFFEFLAGVTGWGIMTAVALVPLSFAVIGVMSGLMLVVVIVNSTREIVPRMLPVLACLLKMPLFATCFPRRRTRPI